MLLVLQESVLYPVNEMHSLIASHEAEKKASSLGFKTKQMHVIHNNCKLLMAEIQQTIIIC